MPKKSNINYQQLFFDILEKKYFNLSLGIIVAYLISSISYKLLLKNVHLNLVFPTISFKKNIEKPPVKKEVVKTYIIQQGDDLWRIGEKFYGSGFNSYDISLANKIVDPSLLVAGQKIIIPKVTPREPTVGEISAASTSQVTYTEGKYVVQPGDSLSLIAQKVYGDLYAWPRLLQANGFLNPDRIEVGMVLTIPR
ncbi:LysM peptidoglycan-binding domain-containing protein [Candidatus Roizmanbacteria bacterium]|nr:LysM peptidoglycan-binding domain-containing protein [Candidatus Roizmanbacteria bacterium]